MFDSLKKSVHNIIKEECDDLIIDILKDKLEINVYKDNKDIVFVVRFAGKLIKEDRVSIK